MNTMHTTHPTAAALIAHFPGQYCEALRRGPEAVEALVSRLLDVLGVEAAVLLPTVQRLARREWTGDDIPF
jgi:hypothetical protein